MFRGLWRGPCHPRRTPACLLRRRTGTAQIDGRGHHLPRIGAGAPSSANRGRGAIFRESGPGRGSAGRGRRIQGRIQGRIVDSVHQTHGRDLVVRRMHDPDHQASARGRPQALRAPAGLPAVRLRQDRAPDARSRRVRPRLGSLTGRIVRSAHGLAVRSSSAAEMHRACQSHPRQHFVSSGVWLHAAKSSTSPDAT